MCFRKLVQRFHRRGQAPEPGESDGVSRQHMRRLRYHAAVEALPDLQRDVFRRHRIDGRSLAEIAETLGLPVTEVECQLAGALVAISDALDRPA